MTTATVERILEVKREAENYYRSIGLSPLTLEWEEEIEYYIFDALKEEGFDTENLMIKIKETV